MKYLLLVLGVFTSTLLHAQFAFYAEGGGNYSDLRITRNPGGTIEGKGGIGWQAGAGVEYHTQFGFFLYLETGLSKQNFKKDSVADGEFKSIESHYTYKPLFLNFPFGIGYQFDLTKQMGLRVYGGVTTQVGIGGKVTRSSTSYQQDSTGQPIVVGSTDETHRIHYGRSIQVQNEFRSDLANAIWGLNIGAGLNFSRSIEAAIFYQEVFTNILPGGDGVPEINKLRTVTLNLRFYFPGQYSNSKSKH